MMAQTENTTCNPEESRIGRILYHQRSVEEGLNNLTLRLAVIRENLCGTLPSKEQTGQPDAAPSNNYLEQLEFCGDSQRQKLERLESEIEYLEEAIGAKPDA